MLILIFSTLVGLSCSHWLSLWILLEVNTLVMVYIIVQDINSSGGSKIQCFKYFVVQVFSSSLLIASFVGLETVSSILFLLCLLVKIGYWPFYLWYISLLSCLPLNSPSMFFILTWQNIMPITILCLSSHSSFFQDFVLGFVVIGLLAPSFLSSKGLGFKPIIIISSVNTTGWLIMISLVSFPVFVFFFSMYIINITLVIYELGGGNFSVRNGLSDRLNVLSVVSSMGGLPPLSIFWSNVLVLLVCFSENLPFIFIFFFIVLVFVIIYFYMWGVSGEILLNPDKLHLPVGSVWRFTLFMVLLLGFVGIISVYLYL